MRLGLELERLLLAPDSEAGEGSSSAAVLDNVVGEDQYGLVDPGSDDELDSLPSTAETGKPSTKVDDEDSGSTTPDEATEASEEATDEEASEEAAAPFSDDSFDRAIDLGWSLAKIERFRDEQALRNELARVEKLSERFKEREAAKTTSKRVEEKHESVDFDKLIADGYDETQINILKAHEERIKVSETEHRERLEKIEQRQAELQVEREEEAWNAKIQRFDKNLTELVKENKAYSDLLGTDGAEKLKRTSKEYQNRNRVLRRQITIENEYLNAGMRVPSESKILQEAVGSLFNGHSQEIARKNLKADIKEASSQALVRTSSSGSKPARGSGAVLEKTERFLRDNP